MNKLVMISAIMGFGGVGVVVVGGAMMYGGNLDVGTILSVVGMVVSLAGVGTLAGCLMVEAEP